MNSKSKAGAGASKMKTSSLLLPGVKLEQWPEVTKGIKIFSKPEDQTVMPGQTASFTVFAEPADLKKDATLKFQWYKNGKPVDGATKPSLVISKASAADVGFYACRVSLGTSGAVVLSDDATAPGARLMLKVGDNTAVSGAIQQVGGSKGCIGTYYGKVTFKNTNGSTWWTPPVGKTSCTLRDVSGYPAPYSPKVEGVDNITLQNWCGAVQVTFPVNTTHRYQFTTYVCNPLPPPPNGGTVTIDISWQ